MTAVEAIVVDATHLELLAAVPELAGQHVAVQIISPVDERTRLLHELQQAYIVQSKSERETEVALAEEGLHGQPPAVDEFPEELVDAWWE
jgi:hypothetical protein